MDEDLAHITVVPLVRRPHRLAPETAERTTPTAARSGRIRNAQFRTGAAHRSPNAASAPRMLPRPTAWRRSAR
jgi:hypothetical protein